MKKPILLASLYLGSSLGASAAVITYTFDADLENSGTIPDGSATPWTDTRSLSGIDGTITSLTVRLDITGGFNGDLYGYLSHEGALVPLLNRVGVSSSNPFGYSDAGLNVIFSDTAANNIHTYQAVPDYHINAANLWQPDGRPISPLSAPATFDAPGTTSLAAYTALNPNGDWTLVLADMSGAGGQATVQSWGLDITTTSVPEPTAKPLALAGAVLLLAQAVRCRTRNLRAPTHE